MVTKQANEVAEVLNDILGGPGIDRSCWYGDITDGLVFGLKRIAESNDGIAAALKDVAAAIRESGNQTPRF